MSQNSDPIAASSRFAADEIPQLFVDQGVHLEVLSTSQRRRSHSPLSPQTVSRDEARLMSP